MKAPIQSAARQKSFPNVWRMNSPGGRSSSETSAWQLRTDQDVRLTRSEHPFEMSRNTHDAIVVVGAGIVGVCTAWHLLRRGTQVTLIDRDPPGRGCSYGNAGAVGPGSIVPLATPGI